MRIFFLAIFTFMMMAFSSYANELSVPQEAIGSALSNYLSSHDLSPYFVGKGEKVEFEFFEPLIEEGDYSLYFLGGALQKGRKPVNALFAVYCDHVKQEVEAKLLFMSDAHPISPQLFFDIINHPALGTVYPGAMKLYESGEAQIYISSHPPKNDMIMQTWTIFSHYEKHVVLVGLQPDGRGGTHFMIMNK